MTEIEAQERMQRHGITAAQQTVYHYRGFRYGNLRDALDYAELVTSRESAPRGDKESTQLTRALP